MAPALFVRLLFQYVQGFVYFLAAAVDALDLIGQDYLVYEAFFRVLVLCDPRQPRAERRYDLVQLHDLIGQLQHLGVLDEKGLVPRHGKIKPDGVFRVKARPVRLRVCILVPVIQFSQQFVRHELTSNPFIVNST